MNKRQKQEIVIALSTGEIICSVVPFSDRNEKSNTFSTGLNQTKKYQ
jgi:hypothetical protein